MGPSADHPHFVFDLDHLESLYRAIKASPFVRSNVTFSAVADAVLLRYEQEDGTLNATASLVHEQNSEGCVAPRPVITFFGGLIAWTRIASALVAERVSGAAARGNRFVLQSRLSMLGNAQLQRRPGDLLVMRRLAVDALAAPEAQQTARDIALGMECSVLAHELGHHCLGHTSEGRLRRHSTSRQDERDADAFAAELLATLPGGESTALGQVMFEILLAWQDHALLRREDGESTHPLSRKRAVAALRARESHLAAIERRFGISEAEILDLLPVEC